MFDQVGDILPRTIQYFAALRGVWEIVLCKTQKILLCQGKRFARLIKNAGRDIDGIIKGNKIPSGTDLAGQIQFFISQNLFNITDVIQ